jgi:hypothetical protein
MPPPPTYKDTFTALSVLNSVISTVDADDNVVKATHVIEEYVQHLQELLEAKIN